MTDLTLSMAVQVKDGGSAPLKKIAAAVEQPAKAAARGMGVLEKLGDTLGNMGMSALGGIRTGVDKLSELMEKAEHSYTSLAAAVGGGIEIGELIKDNEQFDRLRIRTGAAKEQIEGLKDEVFASAIAWGVSTSEIHAGIEAMDGAGESIASIREDTDLLGAAIQRIGGNGELLGGLFATLRQFQGAKGPKDLLADLSILNAQLESIPGGMEAFIPSARSLLSTYNELGQSGPNAVRDIGALYGVIAQATKSPREAYGLTRGLLDRLGDRDVGAALQAHGVRVYDSREDEIKGRIRPLGAILPELFSQYGRNPILFDKILGPEFGRALKGPLSELQNGRSPTLDRLLGVQADPAKFLGEATEAGKELSASLERVHAAILKIGDDTLTGPLDWLAGVLSRAPKISGGIATLIGALGLLSVAGGVLKAAFGPLKWIIGGLGALSGISLSGALVSIGAFTETLAGLVAFSPLLSGMFEALSAGALALGLAIEATPIGWILTAIAAVAGGAYLIYRYWTPIKKFFADLWDGIVARFEAARIGILHALPTWAGGDPSAGRGATGSGDEPAASSAPGAASTRPVVPSAFVSRDGANSRPPRDLRANITLAFQNPPPGLQVGTVTANTGDLTIDVAAGGFAMGTP